MDDLPRSHCLCPQHGSKFSIWPLIKSISGTAICTAALRSRGGRKSSPLETDILLFGSPSLNSVLLAPSGVTLTYQRYTTVDAMPPNLSFGPAGDQWHYDRASKTYDITRGTGNGFRFETTGGPQDTSIALSPELAALVVVDMQNFFLHPSCRAHPTGLAAVDATQRVISKCRELGVQVGNTSNPTSCHQPTMSASVRILKWLNDRWYGSTGA